MAGGFGSGRHRLTDDEKRAKGTFRADQSEAARLERNAAKVIAGPWLKSIPDPEMPLSDVGKAKYMELAQLLFDQNKLTTVTCMDCEVLALHWENVQARKAAGKAPSSDSLKQITAITTRLRIAEDAPAIANPNQKNKFASLGTANRVLSTFRLRAPFAS